MNTYTILQYYEVKHKQTEHNGHHWTKKKHHLYKNSDFNIENKHRLTRKQHLCSSVCVFTSKQFTQLVFKHVQTTCIDMLRSTHNLNTSVFLLFVFCSQKQNSYWLHWSNNVYKMWPWPYILWVHWSTYEHPSFFELPKDSAGQLMAPAGPSPSLALHEAPRARAGDDGAAAEWAVRWGAGEPAVGSCQIKKNNIIYKYTHIYICKHKYVFQICMKIDRNICV